MEQLVWVLLVLVAAIVFGSYTAAVAKAKGYDTAAWFIGGFFFWFIPLIAIVGMPVFDQRKRS
jgi:drug/metabolite transporter (DMT)-like permease